MKTRRVLVLLMLAICFSCIAHAQLSKGGRPSGFEYFPNWETAAEIAVLPEFDVRKLLKEDAADELQPDKAFRFGYPLTVDYTPANSGTWHTLPNGNRLWMLRVRSANAFSLSLGFEQVNLPQDARLFIYNKDRSVVLGAFTSELRYMDNILATELLKGDEIMIEYEVTAPSLNTLPFHISRVSHDYRNIQRVLKDGFGVGNAEYCHVNINCMPAGADFQIVKRSVAAVIVNGINYVTGQPGTFVFSGALVNTTNNSGIPYFLTAYHCYKYQTNPAGWLFRFNWEAEDCPNPLTDPQYLSITGATFRAANSALGMGSDFCLVELSQVPPPAVGAVYAGWDRRNIAAANEICISHPAGDIRKIAKSPTPATQQVYNGVDCWRTGTWTIGCTQKGSSGGPLFNQNKKIVGQLNGGPSGCGKPASDMHDFFGRFYTSWTGENTAATRLKDWLDPQNTNADTVNYYDPNNDAAITGIISPTDLICDVLHRPRVTIKNTGKLKLSKLNISYRIDNDAPVSFFWTGALPPDSSANIYLADFTTVSGAHNLTVYVSSPNENNSNTPGDDTLVRPFSVIDRIPAALPLTEGFEGTTFPPKSWSVVNPDVTTRSWKRFDLAAAPGGMACARKENWTDTFKRTEDHLITPFMDFLASADYTLSFKVAYSNYKDTVEYWDHLQVFISTDCGVHWTKLYDKTGDVLATIPTSVRAFVPTSSQWRTDSIKLNAYISNPRVLIRFTNVNGYGNHIYLDDINITQRNPLPVASFFMQSDTVCAGKELALKNTTTGAVSYAWHIPGGDPSSSVQSNPTVRFNTPGTYSITLTATNASGSQPSVRTVVVMPDLAPVITRTGNILSVSSYGGTYQWYRNGEIVPGATSNTIYVVDDGTYSVAVYTNYDCSARSPSMDVKVLRGEQNSIIVWPNPAHGDIYIQDLNPDTRSVQIAVFNALGQVVYNGTLNGGDKKTLDLRSLSYGLYTIRTIKGSAVANSRVVLR